MVMSTASRKRKGRALQDWTALQIRKAFKLPVADVKPAIMGETGRDVHLSTRAYKKFPYALECKNQEGLKGIYKHYDQACGHGKGEPLLIVKSNHRKPLAIMDAEYFIQELTHD